MIFLNIQDLLPTRVTSLCGKAVMAKNVKMINKAVL